LVKGEKGSDRRRGPGTIHPGMKFFHGLRIPRGILLPPLFIPSILLLLKEEPSHGYLLLKKLSEVGVVDAEMDPSPIYKVLRMLEEQGLAVSEHESGDRGPARKVYRLTKKGNETLTFMAGLIDKATGIIVWFQDKYVELK
jgi:PadR family transcriptional regulator, regulatory protein PadR